MKFKVINGEPLQFHNQNGDLTGTIQISSSGDMIIRPESGSNNIIIGDATTTSTVEFGTTAAPVTLDLLGGGTITSNGNTLNIGSSGDTVRINNAIFTQSLQITGSLRVSGSAYATYFVGDGSGLTNVTSLSASYASTASYVNLVAGPNITINQVGDSFQITGSAGGGNAFPYTGSAQITGSLGITGSLNVTEGITGSLLGTASYAVYSVSASFSETASYVNTLRQSVYISGSLITTGSNTLLGNTSLTGSLNVSGSTTQIGNNTLLGNTTLSGSIIISGSTTSPVTPTIKVYGDIETDGVIKFMPVDKSIDTSISASYIFVSGSTDDLYFSQNGAGYRNLTRLRWLEGNLYTGLLHGGVITTQSSTVYQVSSGSGIIVNLNASLEDDPYPTIQFLEWENLSASIAPLTASYQQAFVGIDATNNIFAQGTPFSNGQFDVIINIGNVLFQNQSTINGVKTQPSVAYGFEQQQNTFNRAFGPLKISGYTLAPSGSSTGSLIVGSGTAYAPGANYTIDPNEPYYVVDSGTNVSKIFRYYQSGSTWVYLTNAGAGYTTIDPEQYSNNGVLATVQPNDWSIQRVYWFPNSVAKAIVVYYGNQSYSTESEAIANISIESFVEAPNTSANAIYLGSIVIRGNGVLTTPADFTIVPGGLFRQVGGSGGGGSIVTQTLSGLSDVGISGPTNGQPLVYNTTAAKWQNQSTLTATLTGNASTATTASYALTASHLNTLNQNLTFNGNLTLNGTASITYLNTIYETASVIYSSGSNQFGDATNDTQTLIGSTILSGSLQLTGSANLPSITGSLQGTASYAVSANNSISASFATSASRAISASYAPTIYNSNGTLNGTRTVDLAGNTIEFVDGFATSTFRFNSDDGNSAASIEATPGSVSLGTSGGGAGKSLNISTTQISLDGKFIVETTRNVSQNNLVVNGDQTVFQDLTVTGSVGIGKTTLPTAKLDVSGSALITGSLKVTQGITGSLFGTASWANNAVTASYIVTAQTASYVNPLVQNVIITGSLVVSASGTPNDFQVGANKLFVSASGNVGIGTLSPISELTISASGVDGILLGTDTSAGNQEQSARLMFGSITASNTVTMFATSGSLNILTGGTPSVSSGTSRMFISSSGNVGIGTQTPTQPLQVAISGSSTIAGTSLSGSALLVGTINNGIGIDNNELYNAGNEFVIGTLGSNNISFRPNSTPRMVISSSGDVGIGITVPTAKLHVNNLNAGNSFLVEDSTNPDSSPFVIDASGNVGIGTTTPNARLDVFGDAIVTGSLKVQVTGTDSTEGITISRTSPFTRAQIIFNSGSSSWRIGQTVGSGGADFNFFNGVSNILTLVHSTGNVGIGTSTPTSGTLQVAGNVFATSFTGSLFGTASWAQNSVTSSYVLNAVSSSFASTASYVNTLNQAVIVTGSVSVNGGITASAFTTTDALITSTTTTINSGVTTIYNIPTASYNGAWFDYTIRSGSNARAGSIMGMWSGTAVNYAETTTTDFGNTSGFALGMSIVGANMILSSSATTNGWTFNAIIRSV